MAAYNRTDKSFLKTFFSIYIVLVLQNVITLSVNLADNIMLGAYSETALAGVAAVNQIQFIYQQLLNALGDGMVIFCSQYWGKRQIGPMKKIAAIAMQAGLIVCTLLFTLVSVFPMQVLSAFTTDTAILGEAAEYLNVIRFTYLFFAVTQILLATLRGTQVVRIAFVLSVQTFFINCGINYVLIYGNFGAPQMGVTGAAIGTLVARIIECAVVIFYVAKKEKNLCMKLRDYFTTNAVLLRDYLRVTAPILLIQGLWGLNTALQTVILGHMNSAAIAANSAASTLFLLVKSVAIGAASTASILIGKAIGQGDLLQVKRYAKTLQKLFLMPGIFGGTLLFFLRIPVLSLYDLAPATKEMANTFLIILSVVCVGMSYQMPVNIGIIRGGGSSDFVVKVDLISIWGIVIPLSFFMAFVVEAPPAVVVCCLNADQIFKCVPAFLKVNYGNWIRKLTRDEID